MNCPLCGFANPARSAHCVSCGTPLPAPPPPAAAEPSPVALQAALPLAVAPGIAWPEVEEAAGSPSPAPPRAAPVAIPPGEEQSVYGAILGPADRENFFAAQQRYRRATWRLTAICAVAAVLVGIPLSIALTPMIYAAIVILTKLVDILLPVPGAVWDAYVWVGSALPETIGALDDPATPDVSENDFSRVPLSLLLSTAVVWLAPGIIAMLMLWMLLRRLFEHGGVGGVLLTLGAREPDFRDFEERQLVNVVAEMAIAAGLPPPQVRLIDAPVSNAAVVGSSRRDATIVVARPLLDDLDRDETQGILAHLIAAIGNGDLRGARSIIAIFETFGFVTLIMTAPVSRASRQRLRRVIRYFRSRHRPDQRAEEARAVAGLLSREAFEHDASDYEFLEDMTAPPQRPFLPLTLLLYFPAVFIAVYLATEVAGVPNELQRLALYGVIALAAGLIWYQWEYAKWFAVYGAKMTRVLVMLPYYLAVMCPQVLLKITIPTLLEPLIALLWRTRRYLADASAVQLSRNPNGVAGGLAVLVTTGALIPGGHWAAPLFVVGPETVDARLAAERRRRMQARAEEALEREAASGKRGMAATWRASREAGEHEVAMLIAEGHRDSAGKSSAPVAFGGDAKPLIAFHPSIDRRLARLRRLGATVGDITPRRGLRQRIRGMYVGTLGAIFTGLFFLFLLVVAVLTVVAAVVLLALSLFFCALLMAAAYALLLVLLP
jgi:Zn-dependent protease with chaperone function